MTTGNDILDMGGIDALLERFRHRRVTQRRLEEAAENFAVDAPTTLRPEVLSSTLLRFEKIAQGLAAEAGDVFRRPVSVALRRQEQVRLGNFLLTLPRPGMTVRIGVSGLDQPALLWFDGTTVSSIIDLRLGGNGASEARDRALTKIERRVLDDLINPTLEVHARGLAPVQSMAFEAGVSFHRAEELGPVAPAETYLVSEYEIDIGLESSWRVGFALPVGQLVDALEATASLPVATDDQEGERRRGLELRLTGVQVGTSVDLGSTELRLSDVTALEAGDVVVLDRRRDESLELLVEGVVKYRGRLGRHGAHLAFAVDGVPDAAREGVEGA